MDSTYHGLLLECNSDKQGFTVLFHNIKSWTLRVSKTMLELLLALRGVVIFTAKRLQTSLHKTRFTPGA